MDEISSQPLQVRPDPLVKAVKSLTVAVWCVAIGIFAIVGFYGYSYARFFLLSGKTRASEMRTMTPSTTGSTPVFSDFQPEKFEGKDFNDLNMNQKIKYASVILLTKNVKDGDLTKAVIAEVVKVKPGTIFHRKAGDELVVSHVYPRKGQCSGDGDLVFMVGPSADFRESASYTGDRVEGPDGVFLSDLREEAKGEGK